MARKKKDNPTNMAVDDVADTLRSASGDLVEAQEGLEAARQPIRDAKAQIKATGMPFDIFRIFHGIRHLEKDEDRQKRIQQVQVCWNALLKDYVTPDLFAGDLVPAVAPATAQTIRETSDRLHEVAPEVAEEQQDRDLPFDPPDAKSDDAPEDPPALVAAEAMPEGAGAVFNEGVLAGRNGHLPEDNPHNPESHEFRLWEQGRAKGAATEAPAEEVPAGAEVIKFSGSTKQREAQAYFYGFDNPGADLSALTQGRRGNIRFAIEAGHKDAVAGAEPRHPRPEAKAKPDAAPAEDAAEPVDDVDEVQATTGIVEVRELEGKFALYDRRSGEPLMDVNGPKSGEAWADQINTFFADQDPSRRDLIEAAMTLGKGRMLTRPPAAVAPVDLRNAV